MSPRSAVLVLVHLAEAVELGGCLAPRAVDRGLGLRGGSFGLRRRVAGGGRGERGVVGLQHRLLGERPGSFRGLEIGTQLDRIVRGERVALATELHQTGVERRSVPAKRLDRDARGDRLLRRAGELRHLLRHGLGIAETLAPRGHTVVQRHDALPEDLLLLPQARELGGQDGQPLGGGRDVGVGGIHLLLQERDLGADLVEPGSRGLERVAGRGQVVIQHLQLGADLTGARVGLLRGVDHRGPDQHALGRDERCGRMRPLLLDRLLDGADEVDVAEHRAGDPARGRLRLDDREQRALAAEPERDRPTSRDREDGAVPLRSVGDGTVPVLVHDGVGERAERRDERPFQTRLDAHQIPEQADRVSLVRPQEP